MRQMVLSSIASFVSVASIATALATVPLYAQRGGHEFGRGAAGMHSGPAFSAHGFDGVNRFNGFSGSTRPYGFSGSNGFAPPPSFGAFRAPLRQSPAYRARGVYSNHGDHSRWRHYPLISTYGVYAVPNFVGYPFGWGLNWAGDWDNWGNASNNYDQPTQNPQPAQEAGQAPGQFDEGYAPQPPSAEIAENPGPVDLYRPPYQGAGPATEVHPQPATTLIFKNGHPAEEVHNYILTRNALFDLDGGARREIPLASIDLVATMEANRSAGVDFSLPSNP